MTMILSSKPESLSPFWARCDEGARLWNHREHPGVNVCGQRRSSRKSRHSGKMKQKRRKKTANSSSTSSDDEYYLRWNPTGDFDSDDDDWWSEIMALEQSERKGRCYKKTRCEKSDMYIQYKYHTKRVIEWGNSFWAEDNRMTSDISLRTIIWRLNTLAFRGISMPKMIYRNLELAVTLREEFQLRFVSERKITEKDVEARKKSRKYPKSTDPSALLSPWPRNIGNRDTSDNTDADTVEDRTLLIDKYDSHRWILDQLKALLELFGDGSGSEKFDSVNGNNSRVSVATETSRESERSIDKCSQKALLHSCTSKEHLLEINPFPNFARTTEFVSTEKHKNSETGAKRKKRVPKHVKLLIDKGHKNILRDTSESESDVGAFVGESLLSNDMFSSLTDEKSSDRSDHSCKRDSVWDLSFLEFEEVTVLEIDVVTSPQEDDISLPNSEPPEDWELLLEEDEEETVSEILELEVTAARDRVEKSTSRVALSTKQLGMTKIELPKGDVGGIENKHPNHPNRNNIPKKLNKPLYIMSKENGKRKNIKNETVRKGCLFTGNDC